MRTRAQCCIGVAWHGFAYMALLCSSCSGKQAAPAVVSGQEAAGASAGVTEGGRTAAGGPAAAGTSPMPRSGSGGAGAPAAIGGRPVAGGDMSVSAGGTLAAQGGSDAAGSSGAGASEPVGAGSECTRDLLSAGVAAYFQALAAHDASSLALATPVKLTENGVTVQVGDGLWKTAGSLKLERSALDIQTCSSVTESVVSEGDADIVVGLRLKYTAQRISEIESIVVRKGDYLSDPMALLGTASDDWETVVPVDQRASREVLQKFVDRYFSNFPAGACMFASDCARFENGFSPGKCSLGLSCSEKAMSRPAMETRLSVLDVEAGIAVGFTMFSGQYSDFHMFKVRGGEVHGVHAVLAKASGPGW